MKNKLCSNNNAGGYADGRYAVINIVPGKLIYIILFILQLLILIRKLPYKVTMSADPAIYLVSRSATVWDTLSLRHALSWQLMLMIMVSSAMPLCCPVPHSHLHAGDF